MYFAQMHFDAHDDDELRAALHKALPNLGFLVTDPDSGKQLARGSVNGERVILNRGKYLVRLTGIKPAPAAVPFQLSPELELELTRDEKGKLVVP